MVLGEFGGGALYPHTNINLHTCSHDVSCSFANGLTVVCIRVTLHHDGAAVSFRWNGGSNTSRVEPASNAGMNTSTSD